MNILITNDDGYNSEGIISLYHQFGEDKGNFIKRLIVVAPDRERSVSGHSITYQIPVRIKEVYKDGKMEIFSCTGSPADCVIIANGYSEENIDLIISGINRGANMGLDLMVSGTFSAISEGYVYGIPGISISLFQYDDPDYTFASIFMYEFVKNYKDYLFKFRDILLNVNIPPFKDLKKDVDPLVTYQSNFRHVAHLEARHDPRQNLYFWIYWKRNNYAVDKNFYEKIERYVQGKEEISDIEAVYNGCISITPILLDFNLVRNSKKFEKMNIDNVFIELKEVIKKTASIAFRNSLNKIEKYFSSIKKKGE